MKIVFDRIEIHNFWSFADEELDFSKDKGITLIYGRNNDFPTEGAANGAGKSAIWSALTWGLFGKLPSGVKSEHISNRFIDNNETRVAVYLTADGQSYKAVSGLKKKNGYFSLFKIGNDGSEEDITLSTIQETRDYFEKEVLGCDLSLFLRTILLTSDQEYNFYMLKKAAKKEFIEKLFDIGDFGLMYNLIHKDILSYDKQLIAHQNQLVVLNNQQEECQRSIEDYNRTKEAKLVLIQERIKTFNDTLERQKANQPEDYSEKMKKCELAIKKIQASKKELSDKLTSLMNELSDIKAKKSAAAAKIDIYTKTIGKHGDIYSKLCEDCKPIFSKHYSLDKCKSDIDKLNLAVVKITSMIESKNEEIASTRAKITQLLDKENEANDILEQLTDKIGVYDRVVRETKLAIDHANNEAKELMGSETPYDSMLKSIQSKIASENSILEKMTEEYKYLKCSEDIVSQDTLRKFIIKDLIVLINNRIKYYLTKMGSKYSVIFDVDLDYEFITEGGKCEYMNFSCGERCRINIATAFAFRDFMAARNNLSSNILALDEYLDHGLDTMALESILKLFKDFNKETGLKIYVVSHRPEVKNDAYDHYVRVEKTNNISHIISADE